MPKPPTHLSFLSTILKGWHRFWARWSKKRQQWQLTGIHIMVQSLVTTSSFILMPAVSASHKQAWACTTLFQLQWMTCIQSWRGLDNISHQMRWRYFILTHPTKCKITRTEFNWKRSDAFNLTQASNQFFFAFSSFFFFSAFVLFIHLFIEQS